MKPGKCRGFVIIRERSATKKQVIEGKPIISINEKLVKYLGKKYNKTLKDKEQKEETVGEVKKFEKDREVQGTRKIEGKDGTAHAPPKIVTASDHLQFILFKSQGDTKKDDIKVEKVVGTPKIPLS